MKNINLKKNNTEVHCICDFPENPEDVLIIIHGMGSSKESPNASFMSEYFREKGFGVIAYDQPGHNNDEELLISNALESLETVENFVTDNYPDANLSYFGSSFGAYILGIYLSKHLNSGKKAFMRCAAVNFPELILGDEEAYKDALKEIDKNGYVSIDLGTGMPVDFTKAFLDELAVNNLTAMFDNSLPDIPLRFAHGEDDDTVPVDAVITFAKRYGYHITVFPGEGHSISNKKDSPSKVASLAYEHIKTDA